MSIQRLDLLFAAALVVFGVWLIHSGIGYGVMQGTTPGAGLFPVILGCIIAVLSAVNLFRSITAREEVDAGLSNREAFKVAAVVVTLILAVWLAGYLGLTISVMLAMAAIGLVLRTDPRPVFLAKLAMVSIIAPLICLLLFDNLLGVPIPKGPLGF